ncbi:MAG: hypothetical protein R3B40_04700 [Polyangiales bacterium]|nr:hypothetical protein [Myxococcales bacterium]MCB9662137.1 hypothetical protein [Sandaracinaceae bacterium]
MRESWFVLLLVGPLWASSACDSPATLHGRGGRVGAPQHAASRPRVAHPTDARADAGAEPHPVMAAYRAGLTRFLGEGALPELDNVSLRDTQHGDAERLRYMAADRVVRVLLPLALEAQHDVVLDEHARRLRALPPILNRDVDLAVLPIVREAMRALRRVEAGLAAERVPLRGLPTEEPPAARETAPQVAAGEVPDAFDYAAADVVDPAAEAEYAEALAEYAEAYAARHGVSDLHADAAAAAAADALAAGSMFEHVVERYGVRREDAVREATSLYSDMADAARRRERVPRPRPPEPPAAPIEPDVIP